MAITAGSTVRLLPPWNALYPAGATFYVLERRGQTCLLNVNNAPIPPTRTDKEIADEVRAQELAAMGATDFGLQFLEEVV